MARSPSSVLFLLDSLPTCLESSRMPKFKAEYNSLIPISTGSFAAYPRNDDAYRTVSLTDNFEGCCGRFVHLQSSRSFCTNNPSTTLPASDGNWTGNLRTDSPVPAENVERAKDNATLQTKPTRHVDYLSHDWEEDNIWSSWVHIKSNRKTYYDSDRLTNALWRIWMKSKYQLKIASAEGLNL
jgi:hypothetical protein